MGLTLRIVSLLADIGFVVAIFGLRQTLVAMVDGGSLTHHVWHGLKRIRTWRRLKFMFKAIKLTWLKGRPDAELSEMLLAKFSAEEMELFNQAEAFGKAGPTHPVQKVAAARSVAWASIAVSAASVTLAFRIAGHVLQYFFA